MNNKGPEPESNLNLTTKILPNGKNHVLGIAINEYVHLPKLNNPYKGVSKFIDLLLKKYNFESDNIKFIKDREVNRRRIEHEFDKLIDIVQPQDNLVIYFSGHGRYRHKRGGYWIPFDAGPNDDDWPDYIPNIVIKDYIGKINSFHTFLIVDSCFSGAIFEEEEKEKFIANRRETEPSRWCLTAGKKEPVSDGPQGEYSPFASALLKVLKNAKKPPGVMKICDKVIQRVIEKGEDQTPKGSILKVKGNEGGEMVFHFRNNQETNDWRATLEEDSLEAYHKFRGKYPDSLHINEVMQKIGILEVKEKEIWDAVDKESDAALRQYIYDYPKTRYYREAENGLEELRRNKSPLASDNKLLEFIDPHSQTLVTTHLVLIKGGIYEMGDIIDEDNNYLTTVHKVGLSDFMLAKHQLTFEEFDEFCIATGFPSPKDETWGRETRPVINLSWYDAVAYCNWRSQQETLDPVYQIEGDYISANWKNNGYRLPTEAEWEYAARELGKEIRFGNGTDIANPSEINFNCEGYKIEGEYRAQTVPVGSLNCPNSLGLHDMSGNVWEWCWDWLEDYPLEDQIDPRGPESGKFAVARGGGWNSSFGEIQASNREGFSRNTKLNYLGFRLARSVRK